MGIENEVAKTPREHFTRDADDEPQAREGTLQRSPFGRQSRGRPEPRTLLAPAEIWRDATQRGLGQHLRA